MSFQQPPQQPTGTGGSTGQQQQGLRLQDVQSPSERQALDAIQQSIEVCAFCADQCIRMGDPNMAECIRLCEDVTELGETALALVPRQSAQTAQVLQAFQQAAQQCAQECGQHAHAHCQECATVLPQAAQTAQTLLGNQGGGMVQ